MVLLDTIRQAMKVSAIGSELLRAICAIVLLLGVIRILGLG